MATNDLWMPFYVGDYLSDTMELTTEQHGAYLLLLMHYWKKGGPIPDNDETLATVCRLPVDRWRQIRGLILGFFWVNSGFLINRRLDAEIARRKAISERNLTNGARGGRPKNPNKTQTKPKQNPSPNPNGTQKKGNTHTHINNPPNPPSGGVGADSGYPEDFESFWKAYPKRVGKGAAFSRWEKIKQSKQLLPRMLEAIEEQRHTEQWQRESGRFIPNPETWLNQKRWLDEPEGVSQRKKIKPIDPMKDGVRLLTDRGMKHTDALMLMGRVHQSVPVEHIEKIVRDAIDTNLYNVSEIFESAIKVSQKRSLAAGATA